MQILLVAFHLALYFDTKPWADPLKLHEVVPHHHLNEMIGPVAPEGEVYQKNKDEHDQFEFFPNLTVLANFPHIHVLKE